MNKFHGVLCMKKLLFVVNVDWFFVSHRLPIATAALEKGYEVHLACTFSDKKKQLEKIGIICHDISFSRSGSYFFNEMMTIFSIRKLIKSIDIDIVHAVTIKPVIYSGLALRTLSKCPAFVVAISGLGYVFTASNFKARLTKRIVSFLYSISLRSNKRMVIFQNKSDEMILSKFVSLNDDEKILIKGSGADLSVYKYIPEIDASNLVVSMACRLLKEKGVYEFIEAARLVKKSNKNVDFWLIGSIDAGNPNSVTQDEVDRWVGEGVIQAFGHRDDIAEIFTRSHIVTMPSFYGEGVPKVLIEAASCGRPIVTTDNPGCKESVIDGKTGIIVPIKNVNALAEALLLLLCDRDKRVLMGKNARKFAVREFDVNNVVDRHLEIYQSFNGR